MFSAILGLIGAGVGAAASIYGAQQAAAAQMYQASVQERIAREQTELQRYSMGMAQDQQRAIMEENAYRRLLEQNNRNELRQERQYAMGEYESYKDQLKREQKYMLDRQLAADKEAARQRALALEEYAKNRALAADERAQALAALREAQAIAKGERDDDLRRFYDTKLQKESERSMMMSLYNKASERLVGERNTELARRGMIEGKINTMTDTLQRVYSQLGDAPTYKRYTEADIAAEEARRAERNMADVDRAADRVASINEANLIRAGIDSGTTGQKKRAEITEQIAYLYEQARAAARDDALKYITGASDVINYGVDKELARRNTVLTEAASVYGAGIDDLIRIPGLPSAVDFNFFNVPTAAYDRSIRSAMDYTSPLAINSAIYDNLNVPAGIANTLNIPSRASMGYQSLPSAITGPAELQFGNPQGYLTTASNIGADLLSNSTTLLRDANAAAAAANMSAGRSFQNLISSIAGFGDQYSNQYSGQTTGRTGTNPAPTYTPTFQSSPWANWNTPLTGYDYFGGPR